MYFYEMNCVSIIHFRSLATCPHSAGKLFVFGYVSPTIKPPDTTVDVDHETQPNTIWD